MKDHYKAAERALAKAEHAYRSANDETDPVWENKLLRDASYNLSFAQAHIGLAQTSRYGEAMGAVGNMADHIVKQPAEEG